MINNNYDYRMPVYGTPGYHIPEYMNTSIRSGGYKKKYKSGGALTLPHMHTYEDDDFDNIEGGNIGEWLVDIVKTPLANAFSQKPEAIPQFLNCNCVIINSNKKCRFLFRNSEVTFF